MLPIVVGINPTLSRQLTTVLVIEVLAVATAVEESAVIISLVCVDITVTFWNVNGPQDS